MSNIYHFAENHHDHPSKENSKLNQIMFKTHVESVDDLKCGSHIILEAVHYLVESIDSRNRTFSAYSICKKKKIKLFERMVCTPQVTLVILNCKEHPDSNIDEALIRAKEELDKTTKRKWRSSDCFVTSMLCGVGHSIPEQYLMNDSVAPSGCTLVTPKVTVSKGDHLVFKDLSNNSRSVIVQEYFSDTRVIVKPPPAEGEEMDLTTYPEVYRVDYCECLPVEEVVKRVNSPVGKRILDKNSHDHSRFVTWAKTGRETTTTITDFLKDMPTTKQRRFSYEKIFSLDEIKPGDHLLESMQGRRRHFMVTERRDRSSFKIIYCQHTFICEEAQILDLSTGQNLYQVRYVDELLTSESSNLFVRRAKSYLGQQLHSPWAHMLFITWAVTGARENFELDTCSQPVSKNRITSFKQVIPGDYLLVKPLTGRTRHCLIVSTESPEQCTAVEYYHDEVLEVNLTLSEPDKFPLYYRVNYEPGTCLPNADSVDQAASLSRHTRFANTSYWNFVHKLKTHQELKVNIDDLQTSPESGSSGNYLGAPQFIQAVTSLDKLTASDHILYRINKPPFRPVYRSALVLQVLENQPVVEIVTMTSEGIVKHSHDLESLPNLHQVVYHACCYSESEVITRANRCLDNQGNHNYDEHYNNSHHFATRCKADREYSLTEFVKELALKEQGWLTIVHMQSDYIIALHSVSPIQVATHSGKRH